MVLSGTRPPVVGLTTYLNQAQMGVWDVRASFLPGPRSTVAERIEELKLH